jgi:hypothetical protein
MGDTSIYVSDVGDIAWLSCFVVLYNLGCLSLSDDEKLRETSIAF